MSQLSRQQWITLIAALINSALISLFPPYDYQSLMHGDVSTFAGFYWIFGSHPNYVVNANFQTLEYLVVLINAGIAWLQFSGQPKSGAKKQFWRRGLLWLVATNLIVMLLFPPFENYASVTKAILPSFEGFYFVFGDNSQRQLVTPILYIEITLLLINAGLIMLFLKDKGNNALSPEEMKLLAKQLQTQQRR